MEHPPRRHRTSHRQKTSRKRQTGRRIPSRPETRSSHRHRRQFSTQAHQAQRRSGEAGQDGHERAIDPLFECEPGGSGDGVADEGFEEVVGGWD